MQGIFAFLSVEKGHWLAVGEIANQLYCWSYLFFITREICNKRGFLYLNILLIARCASLSTGKLFGK
jgi:hypothetical protein